MPIERMAAYIIMGLVFVIALLMTIAGFYADRDGVRSPSHRKHRTGPATDDAGRAESTSPRSGLIAPARLSHAPDRAGRSHG